MQRGTTAGYRSGRTADLAIAEHGFLRTEVNGHHTRGFIGLPCARRGLLTRFHSLIQFAQWPAPQLPHDVRETAWLRTGKAVIGSTQSSTLVSMERIRAAD